MQNTTLYLIRHSIKYDIKDIVENYNTSDSEQIKNEKLILSIEGERRAEILSNEKELQNIDITIENNILKINFIMDGEVNLKEINEYYFTKKIFKGVESFSNKLDLKYIMLIDNKEWKI